MLFPRIDKSTRVVINIIGDICMELVFKAINYKYTEDR